MLLSRYSGCIVLNPYKVGFSNRELRIFLQPLFGLLISGNPMGEQLLSSLSWLRNRFLLYLSYFSALKFSITLHSLSSFYLSQNDFSLWFLEVLGWYKLGRSETSNVCRALKPLGLTFIMSRMGVLFLVFIVNCRSVLVT